MVTSSTSGMYLEANLPTGTWAPTYMAPLENLLCPSTITGTIYNTTIVVWEKLLRIVRSSRRKTPFAGLLAAIEICLRKLLTIFFLMEILSSRTITRRKRQFRWWRHPKSNRTLRWRHLKLTEIMSARQGLQSWGWRHPITLPSSRTLDTSLNNLHYRLSIAQFKKKTLEWFYENA